MRLSLALVPLPHCPCHFMSCTCAVPGDLAAQVNRSVEIITRLLAFDETARFVFVHTIYCKRTFDNAARTLLSIRKPDMLIMISCSCPMRGSVALFRYVFASLANDEPSNTSIRKRKGPSI